MRFLGLRDRFDFCAECLGSFITDNLGRTESDEELPMGFTVSRMEDAGDWSRSLGVIEADWRSRYGMV